MSSTPFTKRFQQLVKDLNDTELGYILGISADAARKMRAGDIKTLKLHAALRLARELGVTPWYIAGETEPETRSSAPPKRGTSKAAVPATRPRGESRSTEGVSAISDRLSQFQGEVRADFQEFQKRMQDIEAALRDLKAAIVSDSRLQA